MCSDDEFFSQRGKSEILDAILLLALEHYIVVDLYQKASVRYEILDELVTEEVMYVISIYLGLT